MLCTARFSSVLFIVFHFLFPLLHNQSSAHDPMESDCPNDDLLNILIQVQVLHPCLCRASFLAEGSSIHIVDRHLENWIVIRTKHAQCLSCRAKDLYDAVQSVHFRHRSRCRVLLVGTLCAVIPHQYYLVEYSHSESPPSGSVPLLSVH